MFVCCIANSKIFPSNINKIIRSTVWGNSRKGVFTVGNLRDMTETARQSRNFVSISIPKESNTTTKRYFFKNFRRHASSKTENKVVNDALSKTQPTLKRADLQRLFSLAKPERWKLAGAISLLIISSTVTMAIPFSLGKVLDIIYNKDEDREETKQKLNKVCGSLLGIFILGAVCNYGRVFLMSTAGYRMTQALRSKFFNSIIRQEQGWFDKRPTGELINRLSSDTQIVGQALSQNISDGLRSSVMVIAGTGMMFYMSPELALVGLGIVPPIAGGAIIYGRYVRGITRKLQDSLADATKIAEERISNIRTVKSFAKEEVEMDNYKLSVLNVLNLGYKEAKARAIFFGMTGFSGNVIIISVLYYGGAMVSSNSITVGNLSSFLLYAAYIGVSLGGLSSFYSDLNKSVGAASRIWDIMDREPIIPIKGGLIPSNPPKGHIELKNITFSYPSRNSTLIFDGLDLTLAPGKSLAIVGPSGSGKSTIAALLLRLYDPNEGAVFLDGHNIKDLDPVWLRECMGTVSQEPTLFSCSIKDNILYGSDNPNAVTDEELLYVAKEANVYEFVQHLPDGFDTVVGERGIMLSGGQKQRVAIARALMKKPQILLLDEATSALDAQSEYLVQEALERIMKGRTVLTIAHRLSTIQNADQIAVLQKGKIVEQGTYYELLSKNGAFKELMKHQTFEDITRTESTTDTKKDSKESFLTIN